MSGIAGVIRFGGQVGDTEMEAMLQAMRSRGLDRQAFLDAGNAGFAQALLATTPEATAEQQPWRHPETGCVVVSVDYLRSVRCTYLTRLQCRWILHLLLSWSVTLLP